MIFLIGLAYCEPPLLAVSNVTGHIRKKTDRLDRQIGLPLKGKTRWMDNVAVYRVWDIPTNK